MKRNSDILTGRIREAMELERIPPAVDERLRQVYAELPESLPNGKKRAPLWLRRTGMAMGCAALALVMLTAANGVNPALAENLPFIGGVFAAFNRGALSDNMLKTQEGLDSYAAPAGENTVTVPAKTLLEKPVTVSVDQVYYDGAFVYAGLIMEVDGCSDTVYSDNASEYYNVLINGEPQLHWEDERGYCGTEGFAETSSSGWWQQAGNGRYISQQGFLVPEKYRGLESLDVTLRCQGFIDGADGFSLPVNSTPFQLSFTVEQNSAVVKSIEGPVEQNGVTFVSAGAGPGGSVFTVEISGEYNNPALAVRFEDGRSLGFAGEGKRQKLPEGGHRETMFQGGVQPDEERRVVLGLFDKNDSQEWVAVFLLDFSAGTVEIGTAADMKDPPHAQYACGREAVEELEDGLLASQFSWGEEKNSLFLMDTEGPRELTVELWQNGQLMGSALTEGSTWEPEAFYSEEVPRGDGRWDVERIPELPYGMYLVRFYPLRDFDPDSPATVKVFDRSGGSMLLEQVMEWNQPNPYSREIVTVRPEVEDDITEDGAVSSQAE